jgi:hypothetical protein
MDVTTIERLNTLLRDELAAVETYAEALHGCSARFDAEELLQRCQRSHELRARMLRDKIASLGGSPATSSGLRSAWAMSIEADAPGVGDDIAVVALEAGEEQILRDYRARIPRLEAGVRSFVERSLLPAEEFTRRTLGALLARIR